MKIKITKPTEGGGEDPKPKAKIKTKTTLPPTDVYQSQEEVDAANRQLRDLLTRQGASAWDIANSYVARKAGDPRVKYVGDKPAPVTKAYDLPFGVKFDDVISTKEGYGFFHPQSGNFVPVDINAITQKYGKRIK